MTARSGIELSFPMYHTCVETITTKNGQMPEFLRKAELELLPLYRDLPGLVGFSMTKIGDTSAIAFSLWQTRDQAKHALVVSEKLNSGAFAALIERSENQVGVAPFFIVNSDIAGTLSGTVSATASDRAPVGAPVTAHKAPATAAASATPRS